MEVVIGRSLVTGEDVALDLRVASHVGISGQTRSGKSVAAYGILGGLAPFFAEGSAKLFGADPSGLLLQPFAGGYGGVRVLGTERPAAYVEMLGQVVEGMDQRIAWLRRRHLDQWPVFDRGRPLVVVVIEEMPALLPILEADDKAAGRKPADRLAPQWTALLNRLLAESAKAGIRLVLLAQRFAVGEGLSGTARGNVATALTFRVGDRTSVQFLHEGIGPEVADEALDFRPGQCFVQSPAHALDRMLTDRITYDEFSCRVRSVRRTSSTTERQRGREPSKRSAARLTRAGRTNS